MNQLQTVIFLIRHGETDFQYSSDAAIDGKRVLTDRGALQIRKVGEYLQDFMPVAIYSSPIYRTMQTAEILRDAAKIVNEVIEADELLEVYSKQHFASLLHDGPVFLARIAKQHPGEHIVCSSHEDVIEQIVRGLGATAEEADFPCQVGQGYRVVFAEGKFVECTKIDPAHGV